jgi:hypothetical protein
MEKESRRGSSGGRRVLMSFFMLGIERRNA